MMNNNDSLLFGEADVDMDVEKLLALIPSQSPATASEASPGDVTISAQAPTESTGVQEDWWMSNWLKDEPVVVPGVF
jgi:hypothetical protein